MAERQDLLQDIPVRQRTTSRVVAVGNSYGKAVGCAEAAGEPDRILTIKSDQKALQMPFR